MHLRILVLIWRQKGEVPPLFTVPFPVEDVFSQWWEYFFAFYTWKDLNESENKKQKEFEANIFDLYDDASMLQQKAYISDMEDQIAQYKQDIREIEEDGGSVPAQMKMGLKQLKKQLRGAKEEFQEELKRKRQEKKKEEELSESEKKFRARERKFEKELEEMSEGSSSVTTSIQTKEDMTELEEKIQAAGEDLDDR